jgi:hypothetical protein
MDNPTESGDSKQYDPVGNDSLDPSLDGENESRNSLRRVFQDFDIQDTDIEIPTQSAIAEVIEVWVEVSKEKIRQTLA